MELLEDEIMANIVDIVIENLFFHMNMNLLAFHVDIR